MTAKSVTCGELAALLADLGFAPKVYDEHRVVYRNRAEDWLFVLPNRPPETPARESDLRHVRYQLHWRGLMDFTDFDAHFADLAAKS